MRILSLAIQVVMSLASHGPGEHLSCGPRIRPLLLHRSCWPFAQVSYSSNLSINLQPPVYGGNSVKMHVGQILVSLYYFNGQGRCGEGKDEKCDDDKAV